jgi:hypothetical protein
MLKFLAIGNFGLALFFGTAVVVSAKTITRPGPPHNHHVLPGAMDNYGAGGLIEGRSIYRMPEPGTFHGGTDERGYPSGEPQNPRTGD